MCEQLDALALPFPGTYDPPLGAEAMRQALEVHRSGELRDLGLEATLQKVCGLPRDSKRTAEIVNEFQPWREPIAALRTS